MNRKFNLSLAFVILVFSLRSQSSWYSANSVGIYPLFGPGTNCGFGISALNNNAGVSFGDCTAFGYQVMNNEISGMYNTAFGCEAMFGSETGSQNTAVGAFALYNNDAGGLQGDNNTAVGTFALNANTDGDNNTAVGVAALLSNDIFNNNTAVGFEALTTNASNPSGSTGDDNTAGGYKALRNNLSGTRNTALGSNALYSNEFGDDNTAIGANALYFNSTDNVSYGMFNTALGFNALYGNFGGWLNTGIGNDALYSNYNGFYNTAVGSESCRNNSSGILNVGIGNSALYSNSTSDMNTSVGGYALYSTSSSSNVAIGYGSNPSSTGSTPVGNVSAGYNSLLYSTPGSYNTIIGADANVGGSFSNSTAFGYACISQNNDHIWIGNGLTQIVSGRVTPVSDGRFKKNVNYNDVIGLPFILKLRPVQYLFDSKKFIEFQQKNLPDSTKPFRNEIINNRALQTGFIAQEVEEAAVSVGYDFDGVYHPKTENETYGLAYDLFVVPIVKAVQEQQAQIDSIITVGKQLSAKNITQHDSISVFELRRSEIFNRPEQEIEWKFIPEGKMLRIIVSADVRMESPEIKAYRANGSPLVSNYRLVRSNRGELIFEGVFVNECSVFVLIDKKKILNKKITNLTSN